ncbi:MAG TPA: sensor histidine kinase [Bryobacteraceae bacterium]|nr:sensor histidine kinase [Bryobacteraceae bacterium]
MSYGQRPEALDIKWILRGYAILFGLAGFLTMGWGGLVFGADFGGEKWAQVALVRVFGAIAVAAACCAEAFARQSDPFEQRRSLLLFTAGHGVIALVLISQQVTIWGRGIGEGLAGLMTAVTILLLYLVGTAAGEPMPRSLTTLFGTSKLTPARHLRSQYEQQIREAARQEERNRLARDLHDSIKQQIFVIQTAAATAQTRFDSDQPGARTALEQVRGAARDAITEMEVLLDQLRAVPLENAGLIEALKKQCEALGFRTGARVEFKLGVLPSNTSLPPGAHDALLRVAQEALANIGRHARANHVVVSLTAIQGRVEMRIEDDGSGFAPATAGRGQGLANMRARAEEFAGTFDWESRPGRGTTLTFSIPYESVEPASEYRRKALYSASLFVIMVGFLIWRWDWTFAMFTVVAAIWSLRYVVAWRHLRGAAR